MPSMAHVYIYTCLQEGAKRLPWHMYTYIRVYRRAQNADGLFGVGLGRSYALAGQLMACLAWA